MIYKVLRGLSSTLYPLSETALSLLFQLPIWLSCEHKPNCENSTHALTDYLILTGPSVRLPNVQHPLGPRSRFSFSQLMHHARNFESWESDGANSEGSAMICWNPSTGLPLADKRPDSRLYVSDSSSTREGAHRIFGLPDWV